MVFGSGAAREDGARLAAASDEGRRGSEEAAPLMPVVERFVSVNGEGPRSGRLAAFIRFAGCNLDCAWCDTAWANVPDCPHEDVSVAELVRWVAGTGASCVTLTGGEPALQPELPALIERLWGEPWGSAGRVIELETNGSVDLAALDALRRRLARGGAQAARADVLEAFGGSSAASSISQALQMSGFAQGDAPSTAVCFTVDCKLGSSGMEDAMLASNYELLGEGDAVKFVVASLEDLEQARAVIEEHDLCARCEVFLSPVFGCIEPADIVAFMERNALDGVRLQLQLHKIIWPDQERGV